MIKTETRVPPLVLPLTEEQQAQCEDDLLKVKELSHKLQLAIKRRSVLAWKSTIEERKLQGLFGTHISNEKSLATIEEVVDKANKKNAESRPELSELFQNHAPSNESKYSKNNYFCVATEAKTNPTNNLSHPLSNSAQVNGKGEISSKQPNDEEKYHYENALFPRKAKKCTTEAERRRKVTESLVNIRRDLILMRMEDHSIARKLLNIRESMNRQRATVSCDEHAAMLDDFSWEIEEEEEFDEKYKVSDLSSALVRRPDSLLSGSSFLRHMGISKMSMDFRRFSVI